MTWLGYGLGALLAMVALLVGADAVYEPQCRSEPAIGTLIEIPGETMQVIDQGEPNQVWFDVVREPFREGYELDPAHGHIHPNQSEGFEVLEGRAELIVGEQLITLGPGESVVVPANTLHHWRALDNAPVRVRAFFEPRLEVASWFVEFQRHIAEDTMDLFQAAVIVREFPDSSPNMVSPDPWVWDLFARTFAPIGRLLGYSACAD